MGYFVDPESVRHYLDGPQGLFVITHTPFAITFTVEVTAYTGTFKMPKTIHSSMFIYDFCYYREENMSSCDFVPRAVEIIIFIISSIWTLV